MSPETQALMLELIEKGPPQDKMRAVWALGQAEVDGETVFAALRRQAEAEMPELRAATMFALGRGGFAGAVPLLLAGVRDADWQVRVEALLALRAFEPAARISAGALRALGEDTDAAVRLAAAQALQELLRPADAPALLAAAGTEASPRVRAAAVLALARLALPDTPATAGRLDPFLEDADAQVRAAAVGVVRAAGLSASAPAVRGLLADAAPEVRRAAAAAWARVGGEGAAADLVPLCADGDPTVREAAAVALGRRPGEAPLEVLSRLQEDAYRTVRRAASESLLAVAGGDAERAAAVGELAVANVRSESHLRRLEGLYLVGRLERVELCHAAAEALEGVADTPAERLLIWAIGRCGAEAFAERVVGQIKGPDDAFRLHAAISVGLLRYTPAIPFIDATVSETKTEMGVVFYVYGGQPRTELVRSLTMMKTPRARQALLKRVSQVKPVEPEASFALALAHLMEDPPAGLAERLVKTYAAEEITGEQQRLIYRAVTDLRGAEPDLEPPPPPRPSYDYFFLESKQR
jgi:HEAT repeat protein